MNILKKIPWFRLLRILGLILFVYILFTIDFPSAWQILKSASLSYILLALLFQLILLIIKAHRWFLLRKAQEEKVGWIINSARFFESYTIGVVTPGRIGEFIKAGHEKQKDEKFISIIRIFYERGFDLGLFALISGLFFIYFFADTLPHIGSLIALGGTLVLIFSFLLMCSKKIINLVFLLTEKIRKRKMNTENLNYSFSHTSFILLLSILTNISYFISAYFLAFAVKINDSFLNISGTVSITGIINLLPITIMGMGTREASFLYFLAEYPNSQVIAFSLLMFLIAQIGGALISLLLSQILFYINKKTSNG